MIINELEDKYLDYLLNKRFEKILQSPQEQNYYNPSVNNKSSTFNLFYGRKEYERAFNNHINSVNSNPIFIENESSNVKSYKDTIYEKNLYGKINLNNQVIQVKEKSPIDLIKVIDPNKTAVCLGFVSDAFNDLKANYETKKRKGLVTESSVYFNIEIVRGMESPHLQYNTYMLSYIKVFYKYLYNTKLIKEINDISGYISAFLKFFAENNEFPLIKTKFIHSNLCSNHVSGLMIDLKLEKHDDDLLKFETYVKDPMFVAFSKFAMEYGFSIDKHYPWRLIADINSPAMKKYMLNYGFNNANQMMANTYDLVYKQELIYLIIFLYNSYIELMKNLQNNIVTTFKTKTFNETICVSSKKLKLKYLNFEEYLQLIPDLYWIKFYLYIKMLQHNVSGDQSTYDNHLSQALDIYRYQSLNKSLDYINNICGEFKPFIADRNIKIS